MKDTKIKLETISYLLAIDKLDIKHENYLNYEFITLTPIFSHRAK